MLDAEAKDTLLRYPWPGNVRELKNVMQRARLLAKDTTIQACDLALPAINALQFRITWSLIRKI